MYISTRSLTSGLGGSEWLTPRAGRFTPGQETRCSLCGSLGRPQGRSERVWKILPAPGFDPPTAQPLASRYTG